MVFDLAGRLVSVVGSDLRSSALPFPKIMNSILVSVMRIRVYDIRCDQMDPALCIKTAMLFHSVS